MAGKKRKRNRYIEYDYEALYRNYLESLDEYFVEQLLKTGKVRCLYATKEIYAGDQLEIEIYPEFTRAQAKQEGIPPVSKKKRKEAQARLNTKNSEKEFWRFAEHNFSNGDFWFTFTYESEPKNIEEAEKNIRNFIRNVNGKRKRRGLFNMKYMYVIEAVSEDGRIVRVHHHVLMDNLLDWETVEATWKHGRRNNFRLLDKDENGICGAAVYMAKFKEDTRRRKYTKRWRRSTNLKKPPEKKHHQTRKKAVTEMVRNRDFIKEFTEASPRYKGYVYTKAEVYYNNFNARFYIRIRMRKEKHGGSNGKPKEASADRAGGPRVNVEPGKHGEASGEK